MASSQERIQTHWERYRSYMLTERLSARQIEQCRMAFYAGAQGMHTILLFEIASLPSPQADDELHGVEQEMEAFARKVRWTRDEEG